VEVSVFNLSSARVSLRAHRHWRRIEGERTADGPFAVEIELTGDVRDLYTLGEFPDLMDLGRQCTLRVRVELKTFQRDGSVGVTAHIDDKFLFRCVKDEVAAIASTPVLWSYDEKLLDVVTAATRLPSSPFSDTDGKLALNVWPMIDDDLHLLTWMIQDFIKEDVEKGDLPQGFDSPAALSAVEALSDLLGPIYRTVAETVSRSLALGRVPASRTTPTDSDLTYALNAEATAVEYARDNRTRIFGDPQFAELALGLARVVVRTVNEETARKHSTKGTEQVAAPRDGTSKADQLAEHVNRVLRDHLLLERSYQVHADVEFIYREDGVVQFLSPRGTRSSRSTVGVSNRVLVKLDLMDAERRSFSFDEVGSGMGYVLPVLVAVFSFAQAVVEQPELHLHPALQASLGDVFLDAMNACERRQLLVETHSEHVLLRVLKRVRQTNSRASVDPAIRCMPDDISVLYFDPLPSGETRVVRLRLSPDGEFIDRWPRGFFVERDRELFDE
jgi:hypothetical protein